MLDNADLMPANDFRSLVTYDVTPEQIEAKKAAYAALEATTPKGYEEVRKAIGDLRGLRVAIEDRRKELKKDSLEFGRLVDGEAKRITALIEGIEEPLKLKKAAVDDEKERLRKEKEAAEKAVLGTIFCIPPQANPARSHLLVGGGKPGRIGSDGSPPLQIDELRALASVVASEYRSDRAIHRGCP